MKIDLFLELMICISEFAANWFLSLITKSTSESMYGDSNGKIFNLLKYSVQEPCSSSTHYNSDDPVLYFKNNISTSGISPQNNSVIHNGVKRCVGYHFQSFQRHKWFNHSNCKTCCS
jgi:hypothetical protein